MTGRVVVFCVFSIVAPQACDPEVPLALIAAVLFCLQALLPAPITHPASDAAAQAALQELLKRLQQQQQQQQQLPAGSHAAAVTLLL
jgi:hypothetical protein